MCGIVGIFSYKASAPQADLAELIAIRDAMAARGPDGAGQWLSLDRRVALGHRRLALVDLSESGAQPMATADGALHITFNGEIYNYQAIRARLGPRRAFSSRIPIPRCCSISMLRRGLRCWTSCAACMPSASGMRGAGNCLPRAILSG